MRNQTRALSPANSDAINDLLGGVLEASLVLGVTGDGIIGDGTLEALAGTTVGVGVDLVGVAVDADGGVSGGGLRGLAAGDGSGAGGDVGVGGVEVGLDGGLLRLGEAGGALVDDVLLVLAGLVDDGLGGFISVAPLTFAERSGLPGP